MSKSEQEVDYLLARGRLSGAEKERILGQVLNASAPVSSGKRLLAYLQLPQRRLVWAAGLAALVAVAIPAGLYLDETEPDTKPTDFRPKGSDQPFVIEAGCAQACHLGSTLMLKVVGARERAYLAAYAEDGEKKRIWYFPSEQGEMPMLAPVSEPVVLPRGARIGNDHHPGRYVLHLVVVRAPLSRDEMMQPDKVAESKLAELTTPLEILP